MPNIKISDLPTIAPGFDPDLVFVEVQNTVAGEPASRKATVTELTAGASPLAATYVTVTANAILPNERILTGGTDIDVTDGGAGGNITISLTVGASYFRLTATGRVIGSDAGTSNTGDNVILGGALAGDVNIADGVIALGQNAFAVAAQLDFVGSIAIGQNAGALLDDTRDPWLIIGSNACAVLPGASFHDGNTVIGNNAFLDNAQNNMQGNTVIGFDACRDMTGAGGLGVAASVVVIGMDAGRGTIDASISNTVIIGRAACSDLRAGGVTSSVIIGNSAGESLGGASLNVLIGSSNTINAINLDTSIVIGCNTFAFSGTTENQIIIGHSSVPNILNGDTNILIGNSLGLSGSQEDFNRCIIIGHLAGGDLIDDQNVFAIEQPQGTTSTVARPYLFGNIEAGNLALLNIAAMVGGVETGTRIIPSWADAAPTAGQGVFSMYGAGTDLAATTDTDFVHLYVRSADNNMMFRFEDGTEIALNSAGFAPAAGILAVRSVGNTDAEARFLSYQHNDGTQRAFTGHDNDAVFNIVNEINSGNIEIFATDAASALVAGFILDPNALTTVRGDTGLQLETTGGPMTVSVGGTVQQTTDEEGQLFINTLTGVGFQGGNIISATPGLVSIYGARTATNGVTGGAVEIWGGYAAGTAPGFGGDVGIWGGGAGGGAKSGGSIRLFGGEADQLVGDIFLEGGTATVGGDGGDVNLTGGPGAGAGTRAGGEVNLDGGAGSGGGAGGGVTLTAGAGDTTGAGGTLILDAGDATSAVGGIILIRAGNVATAGVGGRIQIAAGDGGAVGDAGGDVWILTGAGAGTGASGNIYINSSDGTTSAQSSSQSPGLVAIFGIEGTGVTAGNVLIQGALSTGGATGDGGNVLIEGGSSLNTNGNGGDILLTVGTGNGAGVDGVIRTTGQLILPQANTPTLPALAFGDGDSGFFEETDDTITVTLAGTAHWDFNFATFRGNNGVSLVDAAPTATAPNIRPGNADNNTGIGSAAADQLSLIAGGIELLRLVETGVASTDQILLRNVGVGGAAATPLLAFGDGDSGFFESSDDNIVVSAAGVGTVIFGTVGMSAFVAGGPIFLDELPSATNPSFVPNKTDIDTGIGWNALDQLSLISGAVEMLRLVETGVSTTDQLIIGPAGVIGAVATPSLAFGDGNTGLFESADNILNISVGGALAVVMTNGADVALHNNGIEVARTDTTANGGFEVDAGDGFFRVLNLQNQELRRVDGDQGFANDIVSSPVANLTSSLVVSSGEHCIIEGMLRFESASATPGVRWQLDLSAAATLDSSIAWTLIIAGGTVEGDIDLAEVDIIHTMGANVEHVYKFFATFTANATIVPAISFAQNVSDATQTRILDGSWVKYSVVP